MTSPFSKNQLWFILSLVLFLVSAVGASWVQTSSGNVKIKDIRWETPSGFVQSALLLKPAGVSAENPAPAIVVSHGMLNSREMQDSTYVELARRGYVVIAIDMYGHGFSEVLTGPQRDKTRGTGVYDGAELAASLPYVDKSKIGITGHSYGGRSSNWSIDIDNTRVQPLVSAVLLQAADGTYIDPDTKKFVNVYGSRDVGIIAADHDEFFFRGAKPDGTKAIPAEFLETNNAQSFLHFGLQPEEISDVRVADKMYTENVDGKDAARVIYMLEMTHPWVPFSQRSTARVVEFFDHALGAPVAIDSNNQVWQYKEAFNALGLIAFAIFLVSFTKVLLGTPAFASLSREVPPAEPLNKQSPLGWLWGGMVVSAIVSLASYMLLFDPVQTLQPGFRTQYPPLFIGIWAAVNGLFALALLAAYYRANGKSQGMNLREVGVVIGGRTVWLTVLLAIEVIAVAYAIVFVADYLFKVDFRLWVLAIKPFTVERVPFALAMLPLFGLYFVGSSVALNAFQRFTLFGREWVNTAVVGLFASLSGIAVLLLQYGTFYATGEMSPMIQAMEGIYMIPIVVLLFVAAVIARKIYRVTNNPYLGGLINTLAVTLITIANTQTLYTA